MKTLFVSKIISALLFFVNGDAKSQESGVTLTTATVCDGECIKPTLLHSTSYNFTYHQNEEYEITTPAIQLRRARTKNQGKGRSEIWKWDYWCQLQRKVGSCNEKVVKYHYDAQLDQCVAFAYSGCKGNKNNFDSMQACDRQCKGSVLMEIKNMTETEACSLQANSGLCLAMFEKYYHDINDGKCKPFIYGGCGGNVNRFDTEFKCRKRCGLA